MKKVAAYGRKSKAIGGVSIAQAFIKAKNKESTEPWGELVWVYKDQGRRSYELDLLCMAIEGDRVDTVILMDLPPRAEKFFEFMEVMNRKGATLIFPEFAFGTILPSTIMMVAVPKPFHVYSGEELSKLAKRDTHISTEHRSRSGDANPQTPPSDEGTL